jgi:DNA helicase-2/ATP-dependent DNA helicase PcrA
VPRNPSRAGGERQIVLDLSADPPTDAAPEARVLDGLNPEQLAAVTAGDGPLLVVAGAGTGKTSVITRRIAWLIATKRARPSEILALTFTDKAANEMEARVDVLVPYGFTDATISTFHAFGDRLLRENALHLGLAPDYRLLNQAEQALFLRQRLFEMPIKRFRPLGDPARHVAAFVGLFSRAKDEAVTPEDYRRFAAATAGEAALGDEEAAAHAAEQTELAALYAAYQQAMGEAGCADFGDLLLRAVELLDRHPGVLRGLQERYRYVLVDEFQDTNFAQFELVRRIAAAHRNLTVVGDDDQAIYKWRGAAISNILTYTSAYPEARRVVLSRNYRSTQTILDAAYRLIRHNDPDRLEVVEGIDKRLTAEREDGPAPEHLGFDALSDEADAVAGRIADLAAAGDATYRDVAILVRATREADAFLRALNLRGIPYQFTGTRGLYEREEIRLALAFLRALARPRDNLSLFVLGTSSLYDIPATDLSRCLEVASRGHRSLEHVMRNLSRYEELVGEIGERARAAVERLVDDLDATRAASVSAPSGRVLYTYLMERTGYVRRLATSGDPLDESRVRNLALFFDIVAKAASLLRYDRVPELVAHLDELVEAGDDPSVADDDGEADAVRVMTVHRAKGLEFPFVFVVSCVDQRFPTIRRRDPIELPMALSHDLPTEGDHHVEEERRLFYVAMTRAKLRLWLTSARDYGGRRERKVSRFVLEALDLPRVDTKRTRSSALAQIERHAPPPTESARLPGILPEEEPISLSFRQIDDYETCPLKYKYVHILRVPVTRDHRVAYGSAIHEAVQEYNRRRARRQSMSREDLLAYFERVWVNEGFVSREHEDLRMNEGRRVLARFHDFEEASEAAPTMVETPFSFHVDNTRVRGRWDRVDIRDGAVTIIDFKTSDVREKDKADKRVADSLQLHLYALGHREMYGKLPDWLELRFLGPDGIVVGRRPPGEAGVQSAREALRHAAAGIRRAVFDATPDWHRACRYCALQSICPFTARTE